MAVYNPRECGVCNEEFDAEVRRPRTLPCSHHMCTECITQLIEKSRRQCPFCRKWFEAKSANDVMVNHGVEDFIKFSSVRDSSSTEPSLKPSAPELQDLDIHTLRNEGQSISRHLLVTFEHMRSNIKGSIQKVSSLKTEMQTEIARIETELMPKIHSIVAENSQVVDGLNVAHEKLVLQLEESEVKKEHLRIAVDEVNNALTFEEVHSAMERLKISQDKLQDWMEGWKITSSSSDDGEIFQNAMKVHKSSKTKISVALKMLNADVAKCKEGEKDVEVVDSGEEREEEEEEEEEAEEEEEEDDDTSDPAIGKGLPGPLPITSLRFLSRQVRKLLEKGRVYAVQYRGGFLRSSRLTLVNDRVHVHYLQNKISPPNSYTLEFDDVTRSVSESSKLVFLDFGDDKSLIGRVYIRLASATPRGQNFALHCTGEMGPAYANTHLLEILSRGQKRETIHGGREMTLIKGLSCGGSYLRPWKAGTVGGMANDNFGSRFNIYTKDYPENTLDKAFGIVEQGLNVIEEAIKDRFDVSEIKIVDCGLVLDYST